MPANKSAIANLKNRQTKKKKKKNPSKKQINKQTKIQTNLGPLSGQEWRSKVSILHEALTFNSLVRQVGRH